MEVTKSNYKDALPLIKKAIEECTFCAIDTELTGLRTQNTEHAFDTMEERYEKLYRISKDFLVIQYGISCFQYHEDTKKYTHKDFNFYVFPRQHIPQAPDTMFMCQASSMNFLAGQEFDFGKLLYEGISYLTPAQEQRLSQMIKTLYDEKMQSFLQEQNEARSPRSKQNPHVPHEHRDFINDVQKKVSAFMSGNEKTINLSPCSGYRRKLIYETIQAKHRSGLSLSTSQNDGKQSFIVVTKMTDEEKRDELERKYASDKVDLQDAVGFRKVLEMISDSKKPIIGHNMLLDLLHTVNQFFYSIPQNLNDFKDMTRCIFPHIFDTKELASSPYFKDTFSSTALFVLWEEMLTKPFPIPPVEEAVGFKCYDLNAGKQHEAGYDAFITGMCFVGLTSKIAEHHRLEFISPDSKYLTQHVNRLHIMRHYDVSKLNLEGPDPEPSREHVYYVTFPKEWKTGDIMELFRPFGEIFISWLNDMSALVALKDLSQSVNVKLTLLKSPSTLYRVRPYAEYREMQRTFQSTPSPHDSRSRVVQYVSDPDLPKKRQRTTSNSSMDGSVTNRSITSIPEEVEEGEIDEGERQVTDKQDNCVSTSNDSGSSSSSSSAAGSSTTDSPRPPKKQKVVHDSAANEVSSTDKLFDEPHVW